MNLVTVWMVLILLIPSVLVVPSLGAIGTPANLWALGLFGVWVTSRLMGRTHDHLGFQWAYPAMGVYLAVNVMSYMAAHARGIPGGEALAADRWMLGTLGYIGVALVVADGLDQRDQIGILLRRFTMIVAVEAALGAIQFFTSFEPIEHLKPPGLVLNDGGILTIITSFSDFDRISSTAGHPIEFGVVMAGALPIALHYATHGPNRRALVVRRITVALIGVGVPISISRSSTIALFFGLALMATAWSRRQLLQAAFVGVISVFAFRAAAPSLIGNIIALFTGLGSDDSISARTSDYDAAFDFVARDPWFGRGPNTFDPFDYLLLDNQLLKTLIELGVVGLLGLLVMIVMGMNLGRAVLSRAVDDDARHLGQTLFASIAVLAVTLAPWATAAAMR
ncbi:MAG: O-antigen ligase family protein, partial [Acidimicrobiales bacterium]